MMCLTRWQMCVLAMVLLVGCGKSSGRMAFSGTVTHAGQPVTGTIRLTPAEKGPVATTSIAGGDYRFTSETGPHPGVHEVTIETAAKGQKGASAAPVQPLIWTETTTITAEGGFKTDFDLEAPAPAAPSPLIPLPTDVSNGIVYPQR